MNLAGFDQDLVGFDLIVRNIVAQNFFWDLNMCNEYVRVCKLGIA